MSIFDFLELVCGLALFLYGMNIMGDSLKRSAGNRLKAILASLTSSPFKGFLLGLGVTAIIQSSSATTVMVVGFVNSGTMLLSQAVGVIMGANVGTAVTSWLTALSGIGGGKGADALGFLQWLKPSSWMPVLAIVGLCLTMFAKRSRKRDVGHVLLGFSVLMVGMDLMSGSVSGLKGVVGEIFAMFANNPILGVIAGTLLTALVQSSSASVGILQSLTTTGGITFGAAIPIILGQNIGTCVTAMISSIGAKKNGKRAALVHLYFNVIGVTVFMILFYVIKAFAAPLQEFVGTTIDMWGVAAVHTLFKIFCVIVLMPFSRYLEKLAIATVKDREDDDDAANLIDDRLLNTPSIAIGRCGEVAAKMADMSCKALIASLELFDEYDEKKADMIRGVENKADLYEDALGSYLVKLSAHSTNEGETSEITKLLHIIGDFERISDHAVNFVESAEEMNDKKLSFSSEATRELSVLRAAVTEIIGLARDSFVKNDVILASKVEPLEDVVDALRDEIKLHHVLRLQKSECSIEHGFVLSDILTNLERVSDHCSNIAGCVIEIAHNDLDLHKYTYSIKNSGEEFDRATKEYKRKYSLAKKENN